ncbi:hypothetical protein niasHT_034485 [Heterodera trifolii]|uniref:Uncharacterized protein n=1 Tax=Heterodera trifolii TaxID=157864 RepID=A0ABD2HWU8_9BILA
MLSCFEDIIAIPCGTLLASATGVITKVMESEKKVSVVLVCGSGENFVVTEFKQNSANALQKYLSVGNVLKLQSVKAQRFNEKFDGQKFFQTPFPFEFVVTKHSKICLVKTEVLAAKEFTQLVAGRFYKIKCVLTTPFSLIGEMFAAIVGDLCGKRADLFISGEKLPEMFGQLDSKDQLELKRCFVKIEDECMQLNVLASDVNVCGCKVTIGDKLVTPVKRKSDEAILSPQSAKK